MALGLFLAYRPLADSSVEPLAAIEERGHQREWFFSDFGEAEYRTEHLRAIAALGLLLALEGFFFTFVAGTITFRATEIGLVLLGFFVFVLGSAVAPQIGQGFGWTILGGTIAPMALGIYLQFHPLGAPIPLETLWTTSVPGFVEWVVRSLQLGGLLVAAIASGLSFWVARRDDVD